MPGQPPAGRRPEAGALGPATKAMKPDEVEEERVVAEAGEDLDAAGLRSTLGVVASRRHLTRDRRGAEAGDAELLRAAAVEVDGDCGFVIQFSVVGDVPVYRVPG